MPSFPIFSRPILNAASKLMVSSGWGADRSYRGGVHNGLDAPAKVGTPVRAAAGGTVVDVADWGSNGGKAVVIEHLPGLKTRYLHLDRQLVKRGQSVGRDQLIGYSGATGIAASAAHLHFDIRGTQPWVDEYTRRFGRPNPWPGEITSGGYGIPGEPFFPVDIWMPGVLANAKSRGVPIGTALGVGGIVVGLSLVVFGVYWLLARRK
jgi:murein DD-endopeptidase MepM/ murein hydrolase activator NlpD